MSFYFFFFFFCITSSVCFAFALLHFCLERPVIPEKSMDYRLAALVYKPQGSKCVEKKVVAYSLENMVFATIIALYIV